MIFLMKIKKHMSRKNKRKNVINKGTSINVLSAEPKNCDIALVIDPEKGLLDIVSSKGPIYKILIINSETGHYQIVRPNAESCFTDFDTLLKTYENKIKKEVILEE